MAGSSIKKKKKKKILVVASRLTLGYFGCPDVEGTSLWAANDRSRFFVEIENELI